MSGGVVFSAYAGPAKRSCTEDPYTFTQHVPISKATVEKITTPEERHEMIKRAAYYLSELRGFAPGHELEDWLIAERDVDYACGLIEPHASWDAPNRDPTPP